MGHQQPGVLLESGRPKGAHLRRGKWGRRIRLLLSDLLISVAVLPIDQRKHLGHSMAAFVVWDGLFSAVGREGVQLGSQLTENDPGVRRRQNVSLS